MRLDGYNIDFDWINPNYEEIFKVRLERLQRMREQPEIVHRLKEDGHLKTQPYKFRAIQLVDGSMTFAKL